MNARATVICVVLVTVGAGCSMAFMKTKTQAGAGCTQTQTMPTLDALAGAANLARVALDLALTDDSFKGSPITREQDLAFGVALATTFGLSALYGFSQANACSELVADDAQAAAQRRALARFYRARATRPPPPEPAAVASGARGDAGAREATPPPDAGAPGDADAGAPSAAAPPPAPPVRQQIDDE